MGLFSKKNHLEACPECGWLATYKVPHGPRCSRIDLTSAIHHLNTEMEHTKRNEAHQQHDRRERQRWEAKFHAVRHENNTLRKHLERQRKLIALIEGVKKAHTPDPQP